MDDTNNRGAAAVIETAQQAVQVQELDAEKLYAVRDGRGGLKTLDLEMFRTRPDRRTGTFYPATVDSLIAYVDKHKGEASTIWVHPTDGRIIAVLDDHSERDADWRKHRADLTLLETEEWRFWTAGNGAWFSQEEFAERLQDGIPDIASPDAAELLEIASTLQGTTEVKFKSGVKVSNGEVKIEYDETVQARAGENGALKVPEAFILAVAPFVGSELVQITARLRWRLNGGNVKLGYRLEQPERVVRDALERIAERLEDRFDKKDVYRGTPAD